MNRVEDWITAREEESAIDRCEGRASSSRGEARSVSASLVKRVTLVRYSLRMCDLDIRGTEMHHSRNRPPSLNPNERCEEEIGAASRCRCLVSGEQSTIPTACGVKVRALLAAQPPE